MRTTLARSLVLLPFVLAGCGGSTVYTGPTGPSSYGGSIASTDTVLGAQLYDRYCNGCHPSGGEGRGPAIAGLLIPPASARRQIREGGDHMPGFGADRIDATQLEALLAHLRTIDAVSSGERGATTDPIAVPPSASGDSTEGDEAP
jgi:mono/diheme cytochrome c family protein